MIYRGTYQACRGTFPFPCLVRPDLWIAASASAIAAFENGVVIVETRVREGVDRDRVQRPGGFYLLRSLAPWGVSLALKRQIPGPHIIIIGHSGHSLIIGPGVPSPELVEWE